MDVIGDLGNPQKDAQALEPLVDKLIAALQTEFATINSKIDALVEKFPKISINN